MLSETCETHYEDFNFYKSVDAIQAVLRDTNVFVDTLKPWKLRKNPESTEELKGILHITMEVLRICSTLLTPIIPNLSAKILDKLNVPADKRTFSSLKCYSWNDSQYKNAKLLQEADAVIFKRILGEDKIKKASNY